jgi:hypothetical protein
MRLTMGMVGLLGVGVTFAVAQPPIVTGPAQRTAMLLPPQPLAPTEVGAVARASSEDLSRFLESTPVTRSSTKPNNGPAWLNGTDSYVRPASGIEVQKSAVRSPTPPEGSRREEVNFLTKGFEKLKSAFQSDQPISLGGFPVTSTAQPRVMTPNASFRGTTTTGATVYAGPPAYRWYGWGSVTPGANPYAPSGQYPQASANWYAITGATPGAFPIPVMNPLRTTPGTEPPIYATTPSSRTPLPALPVQSSETKRTSSDAVPSSEAPFASFAQPSIVQNDVVLPPPLPPGRLIPPHQPEPPMVTIPQPMDRPLTVPTLTPINSTQGLNSAEANPVIAPRSGSALNSPVTEPDTATTPMLTPTVQPAPIAPIIGPEASVPSILPGGGIDEQPTWQPSRDQPATNQWSPVGTGTNPRPDRNLSVPIVGVARGQVDDNRTDAISHLIRKVCEGRAGGVDIRWTGNKKLTVCFECPSAAAAQQLVKDISARPELGPYQIDFCVLVK